MLYVVDYFVFRTWQRETILYFNHRTVELFLILGELFGIEQVDDITADFIISQLLILDAEDDKKDIRLIINSPGGSVTAGMSKWFIYFGCL